VCLTCWGRRAAHSHFETAASRSRHRSIPRRDPPDEHGQWRPLLDRLSAPAIAPNVPAEWGRVIFLLASKRQTPEYTGQQLPELNGYRAITAITPTRALCVVGNDPANQTIQIRHEDVTSVDVQQAGQLLWKHHAIRIQTNDQTLKIPDGTDTDLEAAARYIRTAAYEERCAAGERLLECCDVVATSNGFTTVDAVLDAAKTRFQSAVDWGERYDLDTARAEAGVEFTNTCLERADRQVRFEESLTEAQRLVSDARTASINGEEDRAQQQYREAKSKLEAVLSASDEKPSSSVVEAKQLHAKLEEALASGADSSEREKKSSTETETAATEQSSKSDSQRPTRDDLINELQTLTEDLGGAQRHLRWTIKARTRLTSIIGSSDRGTMHWALPGSTEGSRSSLN